MLRRPQVQRYAAESGLRDMMIAEKEVVLTFLLQLFSERGILARLAFKGGTCLRKMYFGNQGRFSTDLDFTGLEEHDHEDVILDMMDAFQEPFQGITFTIPDDSYYETRTASRGVSIQPTRTTGIMAAAKSGFRSAGARRLHCRHNAGNKSSRATSNSSRSHRRRSSALLSRRSLPKRFAPATSETKPVTFSISP
jgi:hypothetical protein